MQPNTVENTSTAWRPLVRAIFESNVRAVAPAVAAGEDPNGKYAGMSLVEIAVFHGEYKVLEALIEAGARVPADIMKVWGVMDIADWMIDPESSEPSYARVAEILLHHGAVPDVLAYNGRPLIEMFPAKKYPRLYHVFSQAMRTPARLS